MKKLAYSLFALAMGVVLVYGMDLLPWKLAFNRTESLPLGIYFSNSNVKDFSRGSLACFTYHAPDWAKGRYLPEGSQICKEVVGLPGDQVEQTGRELFLLHNGKRESLGTMLPSDSQGRTVPLLEWGRKTIPAGQFYLGSTRVTKSFDSRYLGLINQRDITARIYPVLTF